MDGPFSKFMLLFLFYVVGAQCTAEMPRDTFKKFDYINK